MSRRSALSRVSIQVQKQWLRYSKGNFHEQPKISGVNAAAREKLIAYAWAERVRRCEDILRERGVYAAARWPEFAFVIARIHARDLATASKTDPLTPHERQFVAEGGRMTFDSMLHATPERAVLLATARAKVVRSEIKNGMYAVLRKPDVQMWLVPLVHPHLLQKTRLADARVRRLKPVDPTHSIRQQRRLEAKQYRCLCALRQHMQKMLSPLVMDVFREHLVTQILSTRGSLSRTA